MFMDFCFVNIIVMYDYAYYGYTYVHTYVYVQIYIAESRTINIREKHKLMEKQFGVTY